MGRPEGKTTESCSGRTAKTAAPEHLFCLPQFTSLAIREMALREPEDLSKIVAISNGFGDDKRRQGEQRRPSTTQFEQSESIAHFGFIRTQFPPPPMASIRPTASAAAAQLLRSASVTPITRRSMLAAAATPALRRLESSLTPAAPTTAAPAAPRAANNAPDYTAATDRATSYVSLRCEIFSRRDIMIGCSLLTDFSTIETSLLSRSAF